MAKIYIETCFGVNNIVFAFFPFGAGLLIESTVITIIEIIAFIRSFATNYNSLYDHIRNIVQ